MEIRCWPHAPVDDLNAHRPTHFDRGRVPEVVTQLEAIKLLDSAILSHMCTVRRRQRPSAHQRRSAAKGTGPVQHVVSKRSVAENLSRLSKLPGRGATQSPRPLVLIPFGSRLILLQISLDAQVHHGRYDICSTCLYWAWREQMLDDIVSLGLIRWLS